MDASRIRGTAHHWFRLSRQALHAGEYEAKPCLTQLQVFIESQVYWYAVKGVDSLNSALAQAVRCAQALGLDRDYEASSNLQSEIRHRVWWDVCCADTFQSLCLDRQPLLQSYLSKVPLPLNCDDSGLTETSVSPLPLAEPTCSSYRVVLTKAYKVLNRLYAEDGTHLTSYDWISAVDAELVCIINQSPWYMNMSNDKTFAKSREISGYDYIKWQHHVLQNTISMQRLRMHRPFLQTQMRDLCWPKCIDAIEKSFGVYLAIRASDVKNIVQSKKMLVQSFQSFCSVVSVVMFLLIERPKLLQNIQHDIETAIRDLRDLAEANPYLPMAAEGRATLNRLLSAYQAGFHGHNAAAGSLEGINGQALIQDLYEMMGGGLNTRKYLDKIQDTPFDHANPRPIDGRHDHGIRPNTSNDASAFIPNTSTEIMALCPDDSLTLADPYVFPYDNSRNLDLGLHFDVLDWPMEDFEFPARA
ncbi:hypothetical protein H2200_008467 [Cladophialophora chaetospira]|uniref:Xylanolytic transcriptional activator regulatory domain-containing protein n=1 Tax=Cladophialophora chaetospira TaxID=386627 RepID=A0AA38X687_9EURO|nr:hypothetical protein H2200_008467 [Cladophialophora chaetospira]